MRVVRSVAVHVFKESVRDKVFYNLVLFAVLLVAASYLLAQLTAGQEIKIIKDLSLAATSLFGLFIAVFVGIGLVWKEVERRSIYGLLAKPISRPQFIVGKFAGLAVTLFLNIAVMAVAIFAVLAVMAWVQPAAALASLDAPAIDPHLLEAIGLIFMQLMIVTAIALFFSSFSTPILSAVFTFGLYIAGHFNADLHHFENVTTSRPAVVLARGLYYLLPNFASLDVTADVVHGQAIGWMRMTASVAYGVLYCAALIVGASVIFSRRDFK